MKATIEWHDAQKELPKEDGDYLVSHYVSFISLGIEHESTFADVYHWHGNQKLWESTDGLSFSINALMPREDSEECIMAWAELPKPYDPLNEVSV